MYGKENMDREYLAPKSIECCIVAHIRLMKMWFSNPPASTVPRLTFSHISNLLATALQHLLNNLFITAPPLFSITLFCLSFTCDISAVTIDHRSSTCSLVTMCIDPGCARSHHSTPLPLVMLPSLYIPTKHKITSSELDFDCNSSRHPRSLLTKSND